MAYPTDIPLDLRAYSEVVKAYAALVAAAAHDDPVPAFVAEVIERLSHGNELLLATGGNATVEFTGASANTWGQT